MADALSVPWFIIVIVNFTLSPCFTVVGCPAANCLVSARSKTCFTPNKTGSASSSSVAAAVSLGWPVPLPVMASSAGEFSFPPPSLVGLLSGLLSTSMAVSPAPSLASEISARFINNVFWKAASTTSVIGNCTVSPATRLSMAAIGTPFTKTQFGLAAIGKLIPTGI